MASAARRILSRASDAPGAPAPDAIRDAATVVLLRRDGAGPRVLMGQRGKSAAFMPDKFVFPGGAVDAGDAGLFSASRIDGRCADRLARRAKPDVAAALPFAAIRELWEETGLALGRPDPEAAERAVPDAWCGFYGAGLAPHPAPLSFVFRAITPPGRPRRFDARFFLADADELPDGADGVLAGDSELRHLQWIALAEARALPLPFITEVVLSEIEAHLAAPGVARPVPFFDHAGDGSHFRLL